MYPYTPQQGRNACSVWATASAHSRAGNPKVKGWWKSHVQRECPGHVESTSLGRHLSREIGHTPGSQHLPNRAFRNHSDAKTRALLQRPTRCRKLLLYSILCYNKL